jgi:hypothetical protein
LHISAAEGDRRVGKLETYHVFRVAYRLPNGTHRLIEMYYEPFPDAMRWRLANADYLRLSAWPVALGNDHSDLACTQI